MRIKFAVIFFLFWIFALLQNSFFAHLSFFGAVPNFVFIFFFTLVFSASRSGPAQSREIILYSLAGGFFLDAFSDTYFGTSMVALMLAGFLAKEAQKLLRPKQNDRAPFIYFLPVFIFSLIIYDLLLSLANRVPVWAYFKWNFGAEIICNLAVASAAFWIYKKFCNGKNEKISGQKFAFRHRAP